MLMSFLFNIKDHRRKQGLRYELGHILFFSISAILSGAESYRKIHEFISNRYDILDKTFKLNWKSIPAYTTVRNIIQGTSASELENAFRRYSAQLTGTDSESRFVSCDGKVLRGSFDHFQDRKAVQVLSAFLSDNHIILAHEEIAAKTNEIPTAQDLIAALGLTGRIFTFDALHCQEKTLRTAQKTGNDVIVQVKGNQKTLLSDSKAISESATPDGVYQEPINKIRNRIESRKAEVFLSPVFSDNVKWDLAEALIKIERNRLVFDTKSKTWKNSNEISYYISTTVLSAKDFCQAIRNHWGIENRNHHVRDVTLKEDDSRIRTNPHIFAKLRSFAINILRKNKVKNVSTELFSNNMNFEKILNYEGVN